MIGKTVYVEYTEKNNLGIDMKVIYKGIVIDTYLVNMTTYYLVKFTFKIHRQSKVMSIEPSQIIDIDD